MPSAPESRDDEVELPPLDADDGDVPGDVDEDFELDEGLTDGDPFDDRESDDLDAGVELDDLQDQDGDEGEGVDVGADDEGIDFSEESADEGEGPVDVEDDDDELDDGPDDGGAEGTADAPEDEVDEDALPALDADEEGADDGELAETLFAEAIGETTGAAETIGEEAWELVEGAGADVPCVAVAAAGGRVAAGGDAFLLGSGAGPARASAATGGVVAVALADDVLAFANRRGQVLLSRGAAQGAPLGGWSPAVGGVQLAATSGRLFILADGALWSFTTTGERLAVIEKSGVVAIAADGGAIAALERTDGGQLLFRLRRGDDEALPAAPVTAGLRDGRAPRRALLAIADGGHLIGIATDEKIAISRDGGASYLVLDLDETAAIAFTGSGSDAEPVVARGDDDEGGRLALLRVNAKGMTAKVAEIRVATAAANENEDDDVPTPRPGGIPAVALAWDAPSDLLWLASPAGLVAYRRAAKH